MPTMWSSRLFWKLPVAFGAVYMLFAVLYGVVAANQQRNLLTKKMRERLHGNAVLLVEMLEERLANRQYEGLPALIASVGGKLRTRVTIVDEQWTVVADSLEDAQRMGSHGDRPEFRAAAEQGVGDAVRHSATLGQRMYYLALPVKRGGQLHGFVRVALELDSIDDEVADLTRRLLLMTLGAGLLAVPLGYLVVGRIIRPLAQFNAAATAIAGGDFSHRIKLAGKDELGQLASTFNVMQEQIWRRVSLLQEHSDRMETVLSGMVEGVLAVDTQQRVLLANAASRSLLDIATKDVVGRSLLEVARNRKVQQIVLDALQSNLPITREIAMASGQRRRLELLATRLPGTPCPGVVIVLHDVTDLRRLESLRRDFVANVSHELKTPLAAIKAYAETLRLGAINDPQHNLNFIERIEEQAHRLHQLILDLLHLARVETGKEAFYFGEVPLRDAVADCIVQHTAAAASAGVELVSEPNAEDLSAWADPGGVQTILDNLVTNAIKYTPAGGRVTLRWQREGPFARVDVEDTGIGIAPQDQGRVFERFFRVDRARSRELGGTGLGLAIVKHLAQAFGGDVGLRSQLGHGSTFHVRLPLTPQGSRPN